MFRVQGSGFKSLGSGQRFNIHEAPGFIPSYRPVTMRRDRPQVCAQHNILFTRAHY